MWFQLRTVEENQNEDKTQLDSNVSSRYFSLIKRWYLFTLKASAENYWAISAGI